MRILASFREWRIVLYFSLLFIPCSGSNPADRFTVLDSNSVWRCYWWITVLAAQNDWHQASRLPIAYSSVLLAGLRRICGVVGGASGARFPTVIDDRPSCRPLPTTVMFILIASSLYFWQFCNGRLFSDARKSIRLEIIMYSREFRVLSMVSWRFRARDYFYASWNRCQEERIAGDFKCLK